MRSFPLLDRVVLGLCYAAIGYAVLGTPARADSTYPGWDPDGFVDNGEPTYVQEAGTWGMNPYYGRHPLSFVQRHPLIVNSQSASGSAAAYPQAGQDHGCWRSYVASQTRNSYVGMYTGDCW